MKNKSFRKSGWSNKNPSETMSCLEEEISEECEVAFFRNQVFWRSNAFGWSFSPNTLFDSKPSFSEECEVGFFRNVLLVSTLVF
jgi:hypothetical protein